MNPTPILSERLSAVAALIRTNAEVVCDIGTDHALLPIYLVLSGRARKVIASDIAPRPLARAKENVVAWGAHDRVELHIGSGLSGLEACGASDIVIAGMGGEVIIQILEAAAFVRDPRIRLILQPMTRAEVLRKWLGENGFSILRESLAIDRHLYQIMLVTYDGIRRTPSLFACAVGEDNLRSGGPLVRQHLSRLLDVYSARAEGKEKAGVDASEERLLCRRLLDAMEEHP